MNTVKSVLNDIFYGCAIVKSVKVVIFMVKLAKNENSVKMSKKIVKS